jgi:phosphatidylinositol alpha-1,6-mannosyltransferase
MPSRLPDGGIGGEGFGIVYLEAAAHRLPVVAAREGGAVDAVDGERSAVLVDPRDPAAVAGALERLLLDRDLAARLGEAGYAWARRRSWQATGAEVADVLCEVSR